MVRKAVVIALALITSQATAQDTRTTCSALGNTLNCNSKTRPNPYDAGVDEQDTSFQQAYDAARQRRQAQEAKRAAAADADLRKNVIAKMKDGDCDGAAAIALEAGNIDLATKAKGYCATP